MIEAIVLMRREECEGTAHVVFWVAPVHANANLELIDNLSQGRHWAHCRTLVLGLGSGLGGCV